MPSLKLAGFAAFGGGGFELVLGLSRLAHIECGVERGGVALGGVGILIGDVHAAPQVIGAEARQVDREMTLGHRPAGPLAQDGPADAHRQLILLVLADSKLQTGGRGRISDALTQCCNRLLE